MNLLQYGFCLMSRFWPRKSLGIPNSPARDGTCTPCIRGEVLNTGPPGRSLHSFSLEHFQGYFPGELLHTVNQTGRCWWAPRQSSPAEQLGCCGQPPRGGGADLHPVPSCLSTRSLCMVSILWLHLPPLGLDFHLVQGPRRGSSGSLVFTHEVFFSLISSSWVLAFSIKRKNDPGRPFFFLFSTLISPLESRVTDQSGSWMETRKKNKKRKYCQYFIIAIGGV